MAFHEIQFPEKIARGSSGGPGYKTTILETEGGGESRVAHLSVPRHRWSIGKSLISWDDMALLRTFYMARRGALNGFRFKDLTDFTSNADGRTAPTNADQTIGTYTAGTETYQLVKRESDAGGNVVRTIYKPVSGSLVLAINAVNKASGFSVDTTTGIVTITTGGGDTGTVTCGFEYDFPVRFGEDADEILSVTLDNFESGSLRFELVELISDTAAEDDFNYGGATTFAPGVDMSVSKAHGRVLTFNPTTSGIDVALPPKADVALGGPVFYLVNINATNTIDIDDGDTGTSVVTLDVSGGTNPSAILLLGLDASSARTWYAIS